MRGRLELGPRPRRPAPQRAVPRLAAAILVPLALTACGSSSKTPATTPKPAQQTATAASGELVATLAAPNHTPKVGKTWRITVTAQDPGGRPVQAHVKYLFLFNGTVVARRSDFVFTGVFHDTIGWPANAVGLPLTFRAVVSSEIGTKALDYPVEVSR
jgi:hypothetical protein